MRLLVACPKYIFELDVLANKKKTIHSCTGEYYGMSWSEDTLFLGHSNFNNVLLIDFEDYLQNKKGTISHSVKSQSHHSESFLLQAHQIEYYDGLLYIANTGMNCIAIYDPVLESYQNIYLNDKKFDINPDGSKNNHFNSVHVKNGFLWVLAHNHGRSSELFQLSLTSLKVENVMKSGAMWAHNIWISEDFGFVTCNTKSGSLINIQTNECIWRSSEKLLTRGLVATNDYIIVGLSEFGNRYTRNFSDGRIVILNRKTLRTEEEYVLKYSGCVNEIRVIDDIDECHNELPFPNIDTDYSKNVPFRDKVLNMNKLRRLRYNLLRKLA